MAMQNENVQTEDAGLLALWLFLRLHGVNTAFDQIRERCGPTTVGIRAMLRCAGQLGIAARTRTTHWKRLVGMRLPGIVSLRDGGFLLIGRADDNGALVLYPSAPHPKLITRAEFEAIWDGRVVSAGSPGIMQRVRHAIAETWARGRSLAAPALTRGHSFAELILVRGRNLVERVRLTLLDMPVRALRSARHTRRADEDEVAVQVTEAASASDDESGLRALVTLLRCHGVAAEPVQIRHQMGTARIGVADMLRCAKNFGLKARVQKTNWTRLAVTPLPGIAVLRDGGFLILGKLVDDKLLVQRPTIAQPVTMTQAEIEAIWDGDVVLMVRRASLTDLSRRFDISWFLGAIHKYRRLLGEVLLASFFLQVFGVVSPLFFQVVIDKVLVHRSMSTLDVLVVGLVSLTLFEAVLGTLRTYVFAHTTNRIDVELGSRLFRHLMALPIAYFQARRVGNSVARVRELENIRQFLTSSALTLGIDLLFTFVFLAVMLYYSVSLTFVVLASFPFYIGISVGAAPLFRRRLDEKFNRGAENQAFLVESVTGIETLKAMAVEPQMQRRWEEQLAAYVAASFRVLSLNNTASQAVQTVNKLVIAAILYFGAKLVIGGEMSVGELVAFNMLASRVSAPVLRLAQIWQDFHQARLSVDRLGDILNTMPEPGFNPGRAALPAIRGQVTFEHVNFPLPHRRSRGAA